MSVIREEQYSGSCFHPSCSTEMTERDEMLKKEEEPTPPILYHYCSLNTLSKIVGDVGSYGEDVNKDCDRSRMSGSLQMTSFHHLNDPSESLMLKKFCGSHGNKERYFNGILNRSKTFVFCMSELEDNLTMWRSYGDDGRGVCIGFNASALRSLIGVIYNNIPSDSQRNISFDLRRVVYAGSKRCLIKKSRVNSIVFDEVSENVDPNKLKLKDLLDRAMSCWSVKSRDYENEKEWRLIASIGDANFKSGFLKNGYFLDPLHHLSLRYRFSDHEMSERLFLRLDTGCISKIILGPKCGARQEELERYIETHVNSDVEIKSSEKAYA